jgi:hypothetical protein
MQKTIVKVFWVVMRVVQRCNLRLLFIVFTKITKKNKQDPNQTAQTFYWAKLKSDEITMDK